MHGYVINMEIAEITENKTPLCQLIIKQVICA